MTVVPQNPDALIQDSVAGEELRRRVCFFLGSCRSELSGIEVLVQDDTVTLCGELPTFYLRQLALARTRHVSGVRLVVDQIQVGSASYGIHRNPK